MKRNLPFLPLSLLLCLLVCRQTGHTQVVQTGKSYVNLTKGVMGGTIEGNDILEIRATIAVDNWDNSTITRAYFVDTIPANTTYVVNSLKILTNEGLVFKSYTDLSDGDQAMRNGNFLRINMGSTYNGGNPGTVNIGGACNTAVPDAGASGGRIRWDGRPSFYNGVCIMSASYKVLVNIAALPGTIINMPGGAFRYRGSSGDVVSPLLSFELTSPGNAPVMLTLVDMYGRTVKQQTLPAFRGVTSINLPGLEKFPAGMYVLHMQCNDKVINRQVIKTK